MNGKDAPRGGKSFRVCAMFRPYKGSRRFTRDASRTAEDAGRGLAVTRTITVGRLPRPAYSAGQTAETGAEGKRDEQGSKRHDDGIYHGRKEKAVSMV